MHGSAFDRIRSGKLKRLLLRKERERQTLKKRISNELTDRQREILEFLRCFIEKYGYPPTRYEIAQGFGFKSMNASQQHLEALQAKGYILMSEGRSRGISLATRSTGDVSVGIAGNQTAMQTV